MGSEENGSSSRMTRSSNVMDPFYGSGWNPMIPLNQRGDFVNSSNFPAIGFSNHPHYSENPFSSDLVNSFCQISDSNFAQANGLNSLDQLENGVLGPSNNGKRKRKMSIEASNKNVEEEQQKDPSGDTSEFTEKDDEMNRKFNRNVSSKSGNNKQAKDNVGVGSEPSKEDYIHVRARRGQATNSHSLAERVRRERISERMKLLQELVPGCNKITGKAVMLDEIINYVQSLQNQVEFLSMKLATVNPELNVDIEHILSKDILNSRDSKFNTHGNATGLNPSHHFPEFSGNFHGIPSTNPPFHSLPQNLWNNELQNILQMGFDSNPSVSGLGPNGLSKTDQ